MKTETNKDPSGKKTNLERADYCIQTLAIKEDIGMTRIYSASWNPNFFNQESENIEGMETTQRV